jgi:hypothetical protein
VVKHILPFSWFSSLPLFWQAKQHRQSFHYQLSPFYLAYFLPPFKFSQKNLTYRKKTCFLHMWYYQCGITSVVLPLLYFVLVQVSIIAQLKIKIIHISLPGQRKTSSYLSNTEWGGEFYREWRWEKGFDLVGKFL